MRTMTWVLWWACCLYWSWYWVMKWRASRRVNRRLSRPSRAILGLPAAPTALPWWQRFLRDSSGAKPRWPENRATSSPDPVSKNSRSPAATWGGMGAPRNVRIPSQTRHEIFTSLYGEPNHNGCRGECGIEHGPDGDCL